MVDHLIDPTEPVDPRPLPPEGPSVTRWRVVQLVGFLLLAGAVLLYFSGVPSPTAALWLSLILFILGLVLLIAGTMILGMTYD